METKAVPVEKKPVGQKLGFFARKKYGKILGKINGTAPDQYEICKETKGWFARKYPEKAAEIAGRLITDTNSLGITKAAELSEHLVNKGKVESSAKIVAMIEGAAVDGLYVPKDTWEILSRVKDKLHLSSSGLVARNKTQQVLASLKSKM